MNEAEYAGYIQKSYTLEKRCSWVWETYMPEYNKAREEYTLAVKSAKESEDSLKEKLVLGIINEEDIDLSYLDESADAFSIMLDKIEIIFACLDKVYSDVQVLHNNYSEDSPQNNPSTFYNTIVAVLVYGFKEIIEDKQFYEGFGYTFNAPTLEKLFVSDQINELTEDRDHIRAVFEEHGEEYTGPLVLGSHDDGEEDDEDDITHNNL